MEKKMETTLMGYIGVIILGSYWDNGRENGNYYNIIGYILGLYWGYIHYCEAPKQPPIN